MLFLQRTWVQFQAQPPVITALRDMTASCDVHGCSCTLCNAHTAHAHTHTHIIGCETELCRETDLPIYKECELKIITE